VKKMADIGILGLFFLIPLAVVGAVKVVNWLKINWLVRNGHFRVTFRLENHRKRIKFIKPDIDVISYNGRSYPFKNASGYVYYAGNIPEVEYDIHGEQINFLEKNTTSTLDGKNLSALGQRTYNLGKAHGKRIDNIILAVTFVGAGISFLTLLLVASTMA